MTGAAAAASAAAVCLGAAALEGLLAGRGVRARLASLSQPPHSPTFPAWVAIGIGYYAICFFVLVRLFALDPSARRSAAIAAVVVLLAANALWSLAFFRLGSLVAGNAVVAAYAALAVVLEPLLFGLDAPAAAVFLLYVLYLGYATWWLRSLRRLNRGAR